MKKIFAALFVLTLILTLTVSAMSAETVVTVPVLQSDPQKEIGTFGSYTAVIPAGDVDVIYPVEISAKGTLYLDCISEVQKTRYVGLYYDQQCLSQVGYGFVGTFQTGTVSIAVPAAGTYYLRIYPNITSNASDSEGSFAFKPYLASAEDRTLQSGKYTVGAPRLNGETYYKVSITEDGYIGITQNNAKGSAGFIVLCKSDKTEIAGKAIVKDTYYYPVKKGTYYLKGNIYDTCYRLKYTFCKQSSATFAMTNNKEKKINQFGKGDYYLRFKAEKTGTLTLYNTGSYGVDATLCNKSKTALSAKRWMDTSSSHISYAVSQGKTYYFKINNINGDTISLKYKITGVTAGKNTTKAKAATLTKNRQVKFNFIAGENKTSYWYKFTQPGGKKLSVDYSFTGTGGWGAMLYNGNKLVGGIGSNGKCVYTTDKLSKGTYYLKFEAYDKLSNGTLTIKLKS